MHLARLTAVDYITEVLSGSVSRALHYQRFAVQCILLDLQQVFA